MGKLFSRFSIRQKIWGGFGLLLVVLTAVSVGGIQGLSSTKSSVKHVVGDVQPTLVTAMQLEQALESSAQSLGFYLLSAAESDKKSYLSSIAKVDKVMKALKQQKLVVEDAKSQKLIAGIEKKIQKFKSYQASMFKYAVSRVDNMPAVSMAGEKLNPLAQTMLQNISQMLDAEAESDDPAVQEAIKKEIYNLRYTLVNMLSELRAYFFFREESLKQNIALFQGSVNEALGKLKGYAESDSLGFEQSDSLTAVASTFETYEKNLKEVLEVHGGDKWRNDASVIRNEVGPLLASIKSDLSNKVKSLQANAEQESNNLVSSVEGSQGMVSVLFVVGLLIGLACAFLISAIVVKPLNVAVDAMNDIAEGEGDLTRRLNESGHDEIAQLGQAFNKFATKVHSLVSEVISSTAQLSGAASELSIVTGQTSEGVMRQQMETEQVATAMNEMTSTVQEVASHAEQAAAAANEANEESQKGNQVVSSSITSIGALENEITNAAEVISRLETDSENIGTVLDVIRGIAEQTNLLALNAAIEAARAGEQGRGFAVVADEVRTLASRTQESTQEIQTMIERLQHGAHEAVDVMQTSQSRTGETVVHANDAGSALNSIAGSVGRINDMNLQIASAAEEQSAVAEEINQNVVRITDIAQDAAESMQQIATSTDDLAQLSAHLDQLVGNFKV